MHTNASTYISHTFVFFIFHHLVTHTYICLRCLPLQSIMKALCVCVCRECREQRNVTQYSPHFSPHPHPLPISTLGGSSLALLLLLLFVQRQQRQRRTFCFIVSAHSYTRTHIALRSPRQALAESSSLLSLSLSRSVACKCGECSMQKRMPLIRRPVSFQPRYSSLSPQLTSSLPLSNCDAFASL